LKKAKDEQVLQTACGGAIMKHRHCAAQSVEAIQTAALDCFATLAFPDRRSASLRKNGQFVFSVS